MIREIPEELRAACSVFRRARSPRDELTTRQSCAQPFAEEAFGLNPSLARAARTASGVVVMLVPGAGLLADLWSGGGGVGAIEQFVRGETVGTFFRGTGRLQVTGVVPDGVEEVVVTRRNGTSVRLQVPEHAYEVEMTATTIGELPWQVEFRLGGRQCRAGVPGSDPEILRRRGRART